MICIGVGFPEYFKMAATVPDASSEDILRMRMKLNRAVLCQRKLLKLIGSSAKNSSRTPSSHRSLEHLQIPTVNSYSRNSAEFCRDNIKNTHDCRHVPSCFYENAVTGRDSDQKIDPVAYRAPGGCSRRQWSEHCKGPP